MPPSEYLSEYPVERRLFLLVLLCIATPEPSWDQNQKKFVAIYENLLGQDNLLSIRIPSTGSAICCYCGSIEQSKFPVLLKQCPACFSNTTKHRPYFADYLIEMLASKGLNRYIAESYIACAIAAMESARPTVENSNV